MPRMGGYVPTDHKTRHQDGGRDEISIASLEGNPANRGAASGLASLNASSKVVEQPASITDFLTGTPADAEVTKAPTSKWAYDHAADLAAHTRHRAQTYRTGQYVHLDLVQAAAAAAVLANTLYAIPINVPRKMTLDLLAIQVTIGAADKSVRLGIYADGTNLYPGTLVLDAGAVGVATTGVKSIAISQQLTKGLYWLAFVSDGTPTVARSNLLALLLGISATEFTYWNHGWKVAHTYAALPDPFTAGGSLVVDTERIPLVVVEIASLD